MGLLGFLFGWMSKFPKEIKPEFYSKYIDGMVVDPTKMSLHPPYTDKIVANHERYYKVTENLHVPWELVAALHYAKHLCDFRRDLETGSGLPPQDSWSERATVSIGSALEKFTANYAINGWTFEDMLAFAEFYLGDEYYQRGILSPAIWSYTNHYMRGVMTGNHFEQDDIYYRCGVAPLVQLLYKMQGESLRRL